MYKALHSKWISPWIREYIILQDLCEWFQEALFLQATFDKTSSSDAGLQSSVTEAGGTARLLGRYWRFGVSQVVMVYDNDTQQRVVKLAPQLAQLVRGGAAVTAAHV